MLMEYLSAITIPKFVWLFVLHSTWLGEAGGGNGSAGTGYRYTAPSAIKRGGGMRTSPTGMIADS
jgi:hypothetical protein